MPSQANQTLYHMPLPSDEESDGLWTEEVKPGVRRVSAAQLLESRRVDALQVRRTSSPLSFCFGLLQLLSTTSTTDVTMVTVSTAAL